MITTAPPYTFFFSYAQKDKEQDKLLERFFDDLNQAVAKRLNSNQGRSGL